MDDEKQSIEDILAKIEDQFIKGKINEESYINLKEKYQSRLDGSKLDSSKLEILKTKKVVFKETEKIDRLKEKDYSSELGFIGYFIGGWLGYVFRPSVNILGIINYQLQISDITKYYDSKDPLFQNFFQLSIEYVITGFILGSLIGWVIGKFIKK